MNVVVNLIASLILRHLRNEAGNLCTNDCFLRLKGSLLELFVERFSLFPLSSDLCKDLLPSHVLGRHYLFSDRAGERSLLLQGR